MSHEQQQHKMGHAKQQSKARPMDACRARDECLSHARCFARRARNKRSNTCATRTHRARDKRSHTRHKHSRARDKHLSCAQCALARALPRSLRVRYCPHRARDDCCSRVTNIVARAMGPVARDNVATFVKFFFSLFRRFFVLHDKFINFVFPSICHST